MKAKTRSEYSKTRRLAPRFKGRQRGLAKGPACPMCGDPGNLYRMLNMPSRMYCLACSNFFDESDIVRMAAEWEHFLIHAAKGRQKAK